MDLSDAPEKTPGDTTGVRSGDILTSSAVPRPLRYPRPPNGITRIVISLSSAGAQHVHFIALRDRRRMIYEYVVQSGKSYKTGEMGHMAVRALMERDKCGTSNGCASL
jgi:hypothetical protein